MTTKTTECPRCTCPTCDGTDCRPQMKRDEACAGGKVYTFKRPTWSQVGP